MTVTQGGYKDTGHHTEDDNEANSQEIRTLLHPFRRFSCFLQTYSII